MKRSAIILGIITCITVFGFSSVANAQGFGIDPLYRPGSLPTATGDEPKITDDREADRVEAGKEYGIDTVRNELVSKVTNVLLGLAGILAIFFIINNAWWLIASAGGEGIDQHKKGLMWALVGLMLVILSYSIIHYVISIPFQADEPKTEAGASPGAAQPAATTSTSSGSNSSAPLPGSSSGPSSTRRLPEQ